jgi:predicted enzyme related to lactoylglutathione lyase
VPSSVTHFEIYAEEPERLAEFYRELFGWRIDKATAVDYFRIRTGSGDDTSVQGGLLHRPIPGPRSWVHYVDVEAIDAAIAHVVALGGKVVRPKAAVPKTAWYAIVEDPEGNVFGIYQRDATAFPPPEPDI